MTQWPIVTSDPEIETQPKLTQLTQTGPAQTRTKAQAQKPSPGEPSRRTDPIDGPGRAQPRPNDPDPMTVDDPGRQSEPDEAERRTDDGRTQPSQLTKGPGPSQTDVIDGEGSSQPARRAKPDSIEPASPDGQPDPMTMTDSQTGPVDGRPSDGPVIEQWPRQPVTVARPRPQRPSDPSSWRLTAQAQLVTQPSDSDGRTDDPVGYWPRPSGPSQPRRLLKVGQAQPRRTQTGQPSDRPIVNWADSDRTHWRRAQPKPNGPNWPASNY